MKLFLDYFNESVNNYPNNIAVKTSSKQYAYAELNCAANQLANYFLKQSYKQESRIGVLLEPSFEAVLTLLAIWKAGLAYLPLNIQETSAKRLAFFAKDADPVTIVTSSQLIHHPLFSLTNKSSLIIDADQYWQNCSSETPKVNIEPSLLAYLIYTSGSTGKPKGVMIEHKGLGNILQAHIDTMKITAKDVIAQVAPHGFDAHIMEIMMALGTGAALYPVKASDRLHLSALGKIYEQYGITIGIFTPSILKHLTPEHFPSVRALILTGEKLEDQIIKPWHEKKTIINGYGPSEATIGTSLGICELNKSIHAGKAIVGVETFLMDEHSLAEEPKLASSNQGVLVIMSETSLARGYWNLPELTAQRFRTIPHPITNQPVRAYITGDICRLDESNNLHILGRNDRQFKVHGKLISPEEIEEVIHNADNTIERVFVDNTVDHNNYPIITAYLETKQPLNLLSLYNKIENKLHITMLPNRWAIVANFPNTINGKIDHNSLRQDQSIERHYLQVNTSAQPRDDIELNIANIFEEILLLKAHYPQFNYHIADHFLRLGGTSIQSALVVQKINQAFPKQKLSLAEFNQNPSIDAIALNIRWSLSPLPIIKKINSDSASSHSKPKYPIFLIHTLLGNAENDYEKLCQHPVMQNFIVYVISAPAIVSKSNQDLLNMPNNMATLASLYIKEISKIQSDGIVLVGWSAGGIIANEMARQLQMQNKSVSVLAIDSTSPKVLQDMTEIHFAEYLKHLTTRMLLAYLNIPLAQFSVDDLSLEKHDKQKQIELLMAKLGRGNNFTPQLVVIKNMLLAMLSNQVSIWLKVQKHILAGNIPIAFAFSLLVQISKMK